MNKRSFYKEQGITLIALVVTIIVILILAAITIGQIIGDSGMIARAKDATNTWAKASNNEVLIMNSLDGKIEEIINELHNSGNTDNPRYPEEVIIAMGNAQKYPGQTGSDDIGLDAYGNPVNLDLWYYERGYTDAYLYDGMGEGSGDPCFTLFYGYGGPSIEPDPFGEGDGNITFPSYIKFSDEDEFREVTSLGGCTLGGRIGEYFGMYYMDTIILPRHLNDLGRFFSFGYCSCSRIVMFDELTDISSLFWSTSLDDLVIPAGVQTMDEYTFEDCSITNLYIDSQDIAEELWSNDELYIGEIENIYINKNIYDSSMTSITVGSNTYAHSNTQNEDYELYEISN